MSSYFYSSLVLTIANWEHPTRLHCNFNKDCLIEFMVYYISFLMRVSRPKQMHQIANQHQAMSMNL